MREISIRLNILNTTKNCQRICGDYIYIHRGLPCYLPLLEPYYVLAKNPDPYPPNITDYLNSIKSKIGAATAWTETNDNVYYKFAAMGDWMWTVQWTSKPDLENIINSGVRTLIYNGDADYIINFNGVEAMVRLFFHFLSCVPRS